MHREWRIWNGKKKSVLYNQLSWLHLWLKMAKKSKQKENFPEDLLKNRTNHQRIPSQTTRLVSIWDQRRLCVTVWIVWIKVGFWRSNLDAHFFIWDKKDVVYSVRIGLIKTAFGGLISEFQTGFFNGPKKKFSGRKEYLIGEKKEFRRAGELTQKARVRLLVRSFINIDIFSVFNKKKAKRRTLISPNKTRKSGHIP